MKDLFIAEKPSVAMEFAKTLKVDDKNRGKGYLESDQYVVTWCVGHLVTMSYPEVYDEKYKKWNMDQLPFLPDNYLYEVIPDVKKQYDIVAGLLNREDVKKIYVCTDSGREGEYIYRLVDQQARVPADKERKRVWIDSQTDEEIQRGIREAKDLSAYDNICDSAYLRAKEDYLMGINFTRVLSVRYGNWFNHHIKDKKWSSITVGRVMTCVLGMVVRKEWEVRKFVKQPFFRVMGKFSVDGKSYQGEWRVQENSQYFASPKLYKENGFLKEEYAKEFLEKIRDQKPGKIVSLEKKKEKKNPPLLFNLAELQNLSSKVFKISPDQTLQVVQNLYEKKLVTYPRTDARVLSTAVAKEIHKNLKGLQDYPMALPYLKTIAESKSYETIAKTKYCDDKKITDHYAIIPTGQGLRELPRMSELEQKMYEVIVRRFLSIFYPAAIYQKVNLVTELALEGKKEQFFTSSKVLTDPGFLKVSAFSFAKKKDEDKDKDDGLDEILPLLKKGKEVNPEGYEIKEGETSPPKRYTSGSMILAMENAGQLIEEEELRELIKGSGIGTSATRAEILKKLVTIGYIKRNEKTQVLTPTYKGELVYSLVFSTLPVMLQPNMTASWEKGLTMVAEGDLKEEDYRKRLNGFVGEKVQQLKNEASVLGKIDRYVAMIEPYYQTRKRSAT